MIQKVFSGFCAVKQWFYRRSLFISMLFHLVLYLSLIPIFMTAFRFGFVTATLFGSIITAFFAWRYLFNQSEFSFFTPITKKTFTRKITTGTFKSFPFYSLCFVYLGIFFLMYTYSQYFTDYIRAIFPDARYQSYETLGLSEIVSMTFLSIFVAPILEEFLFRGFLYQLLQLKLPKTFAYLLQAFLFALAHGTLYHVWLTFLSGLFFALLFERFRNLWVPVLFHFLFNFFSIRFAFRLNGAFYTSFLFVFTVNLFLLITLIRFYRDTLKERALENNE